ncbi:tRNA pseudouridine(38-40) synthase TruA [Halalkalibacter urbisdiaboli]|uniref:tRNA pseudouridine(38-40) synthase TruA n=1 Tax=Halalkalibacter urbisdiaboli TaxID=1960589 RepID=UPI000B42FA86|nr:tRNA pseudouridine(38-40) synthase TruA [Halalkalibacter urbisdiaboli]
MTRIACKVAYDGTGFSGYQVQPGKRTVQAELERCLQVIHKGESIKVFASGRTDAAVHAKGQVIHFDSSLSIPEKQWPKAINACLPPDIRVMEAVFVDDEFHARFSVKQKEYRYRVSHTKAADVFTRNFSYHHPFNLNIDAMRDGAFYLVGTYDFSSFCAAKTEVQDKVRTLFKLEIEENDEELVFILVGNGFLYNMVRIIVGTLLEIGAGKRSPIEMMAIRDGQNRDLAGKTVPGHGLYLWDVKYDYPVFKSV